MAAARFAFTCLSFPRSLPLSCTTTFECSVGGQKCFSSCKSFSKQPKGHKYSHNYNNGIGNVGSLPALHLLPAGWSRSMLLCTTGGVAAV